jgi:hypothetical protein
VTRCGDHGRAPWYVKNRACVLPRELYNLWRTGQTKSHHAEKEAKEVREIDTSLENLIESFIDSKLNMIDETKDIEFVKKTTTTYIEEWKSDPILFFIEALGIQREHIWSKMHEICTAVNSTSRVAVK